MTEPCDEEDDEDRQDAAGERMHEQLNTAFEADRLNSLQCSGVITLPPYHGVYESIGRSTHPQHADKEKLFFTKWLLPLVIMRKQSEQWLYVWHSWYSEHEQGNPKGPGGSMTWSLFTQQCGHH